MEIAPLVANFLFFLSSIFEKIPTPKHTLKGEISPKVVLQQIQRICHQFRLLPYPYFYPAQKFMSILDMEIKSPGLAKLKKLPEIFNQLNSFNMNDPQVMGLRSQVAFVLVEKQRFPTEYSLFKVFQESSTREEYSTDLSSVMRYTLIMDIMKSYFDHNEPEVAKYLSSINIAYLWKPYEKVFNLITQFEEKYPRDQIRSHMQEDVMHINDQYKNDQQKPPSEGKTLKHIRHIPRLRSLLFDLDGKRVWEAIQEHQRQAQQYYRQFPLDIVLVGDDRTLHNFTHQFLNFCKIKGKQRTAPVMGANARIYLIPAGCNSLAQYLATYDPQYLQQIYLPFRRNPFIEVFAPEGSGASGGYSESAADIRKRVSTTDPFLFDSPRQGGFVSGQSSPSHKYRPSSVRVGDHCLQYLCAKKDDMNARRKLFVNVEGCPPVSALDQQFQIYLRDADSSLDVRVYRVEFGDRPDFSGEKLTSYFFGRFELGQPLGYNEANESLGNYHGKQSSASVIQGDEDLGVIRKQSGISSSFQGIKIKLRLKRHDLMGERDRGYAAYDEELSFPDYRELKEKLNLVKEGNFEDDPEEEEEKSPRAQSIRPDGGHNRSTFAAPKLGTIHITPDAHMAEGSSRAGSRFTVQPIKEDIVETTIYSLHASNVPIESERGVTQANPVSNWLELAYIDPRSFKIEQEFLAAKRKLKATKMQRRASSLTAIYTQLHVSYMKIQIEGNDDEEFSGYPVWLDGVDYSAEVAAKKLRFIRIKLEDRFKLNIKRFMKPDI